MTQSLALDGQDVDALTITATAGLVTLAGGGGSLVTSNGNLVKDVTIDTLIVFLGSEDGYTDGGTLHNLTTTTDRYLSLSGGTFNITGTLTTSAAPGSRSGETYIGASEFGGVLNVNIFDAATNIVVGDCRYETMDAMRLTVNQLSLGGRTLFANAAWIKDVYNPGQAAAGSFLGADNYINGYLIAGQNGQLTIGTTDVNWLSGIALATGNLYFADHREGARVMEGAAQITVAAGVPALSLNVINKVSGLIAAHADLPGDTQPAYGDEPGQMGLWVTPFYGYSDVDGLDTGGKFKNGWELSYGGAAIGIDYNVNETFRLGLALNAGGGDSESQGDFHRTENDFDFFGVSLYGSYTNGAWGLTGDIGYTSIDNAIEQKLPSAMGLGSKLKAEVDSDAFTVGLTGRYRFTAGSGLNITPHLGLRYTKISTDGAEVKSPSHGRVFKVETDDQNLFQIPLGVKFSGDLSTQGGWTITPSADLGALLTMGDTDVDSQARIAGTGYRGVTNADIVDKAAFTGTLGLKAKADNGLSLGLDYGILAGGNQTDHSVSGMLRIEF